MFWRHISCQYSPGKIVLTFVTKTSPHSSHGTSKYRPILSDHANNSKQLLQCNADVILILIRSKKVTGMSSIFLGQGFCNPPPPISTGNKDLLGKSLQLLCQITYYRILQVSDVFDHGLPFKQAELYTIPRRFLRNSLRNLCFPDV